MATTEQTSDTVRRIVEEVLRRIAAESRATPPTASSAAAHAAVSVPQPPPPVGPATSGAVLAERIITLDLLARLPAGTRQVTVPPRAVVTPAARDRARETGVTIVSAAVAAPLAVPTARPVTIGHADCGGDGARRCAAIARSVPAAQQLPPSGLADVVAALAAHAARDGGRGILLTGRPAVAAALANRHSGVRAITGRDAATVVRATAESAANLLVVDPREFFGGLERACADFATRDRGPIPPEFAAPPPPAVTPCSCKTHVH